MNVFSKVFEQNRIKEDEKCPSLYFTIFLNLKSVLGLHSDTIHTLLRNWEKGQLEKHTLSEASDLENKTLI